MSRTLRRVAAAALALTAAVSLAACAGTPAASSDPADGELQTVTPGKLTIATGEIDYEPWFVDDDASNGEGFEGAVANAVAEQLGFDAADIVWVRTGFDAAITPGPKDWDVNIQQFSVTEDRKKAVDFSSPYYTTTQAVVALNDSSAASATSIADLEGAKVGVAAGTTSYTVAKAQLGEESLSVFNTVDDVVLALQSGQIDALVTDLPGAFYLTAAVVDDSTVIGQFEGSDGGDQFAFVLPKDSALTSAVSEAVDALRADGTLDELQQKWLSDTVDVPVLK